MGTYNLGACAAPLVSRFFSLFFTFSDNLRGGSLKIFYYHDVSADCFQSFLLICESFHFSLPSLPFSFCKVGIFQPLWVYTSLFLKA